MVEEGGEVTRGNSKASIVHSGISWDSAVTTGNGLGSSAFSGSVGGGSSSATSTEGAKLTTSGAVSEGTGDFSTTVTSILTCGE